MKKNIIIFIIALIGLVGCFILLCLYSKGKNYKEEFYTIKESKSYVIDDEREMVFNIYSTTKESYITFVEKNTYSLILDDLELELNNIRIKEYSLNDMTLIKIYARVPNITESEISYPNSTLLIENQNYSLSLDLGDISFLNSKYYSLISFQDLYGSYSYINSTLQLVGLNITLTNKYEYIQQIRIGGYSYGTLSKAQKDTKYENEVDIKTIVPSYNVNKIEESYLLSMMSKTYFIPISHKLNNMLKGGYIILKIDNQYCYIDTFDFMVNDLDSIMYKDKMIKGDISYA